jgi:hypothetical protein
MQRFYTISRMVFGPFHKLTLSLVVFDTGNMIDTIIYAITVFMTLYDGLLFFSNSLHMSNTSSLKIGMTPFE